MSEAAEIAELSQKVIFQAEQIEHLEQENARLREELEHSKRALAFYRKVANTRAEKVKGCEECGAEAELEHHGRDLCAACASEEAGA